MMTLGIFIQSAVDNPLFFASVLFTIVVSIVLHELAHGWMAIKLGDDTPIRLERMTVNPVVHMGLFSIIALFLVGIAWGSMPIDHSRLRGKYGAAKVAFAGPMTNLLLAVVVLTGLGVATHYQPGLYPSIRADAQWINNLGLFLLVFGYINLLLFVFNLLPIPPLDGSHILANFHRGYANFIANPSNGGAILIMFVFAFAIANTIFMPIGNLATRYVWWLAELL